MKYRNQPQLVAVVLKFPLEESKRKQIFFYHHNLEIVIERLIVSVDETFDQKQSCWVLSQDLLCFSSQDLDYNFNSLLKNSKANLIQDFSSVEVKNTQDADIQRNVSQCRKLLNSAQKTAGQAQKPFDGC